MAITLKVAHSTIEKNEIYSLRYQVFVEEEGRFETNIPKVADLYDSFEETVNIIAYDEKQAIGTIRVIHANSVGFPAQEHFDFNTFLMQYKHNTACIGWLCSLKKYRKHPGLIMGLFKVAIKEMKKRNHRYIIATIHPPLMSLLETKFNAQQYAETFVSTELGVEMMPITIDIENFPPGSKEPFQDPDDLLLDEGLQRKIYRKNEFIYQENDVGLEAYLVLRGSVRVIPPKSLLDKEITWRTLEGPFSMHDKLLTKGDMFGFLPLLDNEKHVRTAIPYSQEADLMVWPSYLFLDQLQSAPDKSLKLLKALGTRLRRDIKDTKQFHIENLAKRILSDASKEGENPVNKDWLGRQSGLWPQNLEYLLNSWQEQQLITLQDNKIHITDFSGLQKSIAD